MQRIISAGIIVFRRTREGIKFLILYQGRNYWNFPKGKMESEERSWQTALREVQEETGLKSKELKFIKGFKTKEQFSYRHGKNRIQKIVILYLAETSQPHVSIREYHEGYGWFTVGEAKRVLAKYKDSLKILNDAHDYLRKEGLLGRSKNSTRKSTNVQRGRQESRTTKGVSSGREHSQQK